MTRALTKAGYSKFLDGTYLEKITISYMVLFPLLFLHMQQLLLKLLNSSHSSSSLLWRDYRLEEETKRVLWVSHPQLYILSSEHDFILSKMQ